MPCFKNVAVGVALSLAVFLTIVISGDQQARAAALSRGWNNVSYLGTAKTPAEALTAISGQYSSVYRWDPVAQGYQLYAPSAPSFANTLTQLNTGDAIWLNFTEASGTLNTGTTTGSGTTGPGKLSIAYTN